MRRLLSAIGIGPAAPITVRCRCGKSIAVAAEHRGKLIKCKQCGRELRVGSALGLPPWVGAALAPLSLGYLGAICLLTLTLWGLGDAWWPGTILLFIGRWVFLLPLLVLVPLALLLRRGLLIPLGVATLICAGPLMGGRTGWRRLIPHAQGTHVRVVTFNTEGGDAIAPMLSGLLGEWQADFVAFQECGASLAGSIEHLTGWYHHRVRQLCFLSRFPLLDSMVMDRRSLEQLKQSEAGIGGSGDVARYTIRMPQGNVSFTNLHLETPRKGLEGLRSGLFNSSQLASNTELRRIEANLARKWVNGGPSPTLVAGDFNTPVESRIFQDAWGDFTDAFSRAGFGFGMTRPNGWIRVRIDHVLSGDGWYADHIELGPELGSDHLPVIVDLTLIPHN